MCYNDVFNQLIMLKFFKKAKDSFKKFSLGSKIKEIFSKKKDLERLQALEELFYEADMGIFISQELLKKADVFKKTDDTKIVIDHLKNEIKKIIPLQPETEIKNRPHVIIVVGVNGTGKTTSVAKLANYYRSQKKKTMIVAGDTYRAAAMEQLNTWAQRINVDIVKSQANQDPAAVVFDAISKAKANNTDIIIIDTAGRQHTKVNLMLELEKIKKVSLKLIDSKNIETLITVDATIGQNAIDQVKIFNEHIPLSGIILSKLDSSSKGGTIVALQKILSLPVIWIGIGENFKDLEKFNRDKFIDALLSF